MRTSLRPRLTGLILALLLTGPAGLPAASQESAAELTDEQIPAAVLKHIQTQTGKHGTFWVLDSVEGKSLSLKFVKMDEARHGRLGSQTYFASASFVDKAGAPVTVDIVLRGPGPDHFELVEVAVREKDGKARYDWRQEGGLWKKQPLSEAAGGKQPT